MEKDSTKSPGTTSAIINPPSPKISSEEKKSGPEWFESEDFWLNYSPIMFDENKWNEAPAVAECVKKIAGLKEGDSVLDAGCGLGRISVELADLGLDVTGVDLIQAELDAAKEYIMKALEINHHHEYIQFCAGRILYARKEYEEAKRYLVRAVEQNPDIETQNALALTYYELGEYEQARNIFDNLLTKHPDNISVLMSMARCYEGMKDNDKALEYLDKVVEIFPEDEEAHEMIRKLS